MQAQADHLRTEYDIAVIGGGMVGIPLSIGLARSGFSVLLLEKFPIKANAQPQTVHNSFDSRSTALSLGSVEILKDLDLWDADSVQANPINTVHVSEQGRMGTTRIAKTDLQLDALGYVVPNMAFGQYLSSQLLDSKVDVLDGANVSQVVMHDTHAQLIVARDNGGVQELKAKLVIAADGANSPTAQGLGIEYQIKSYEQFAIVANVETELPNEGVAFERFARTGPSALLPLTIDTSALVWTLSEQDAEAAMKLNERDFADKVACLFGDRLGRILNVSKRVSYPLTLKQAKEPVRSRFVVVGNAAHSLHPVAGQGFNLALRGVAGVIEGLRQSSRDAYWSYSVLQNIAQQHQPEQRKIVSFSDQLIDVFSPESHIPALARSAGLVTLNGLSQLKSEFAKHAMGRAQIFDLERA